MGDFGRSLVIMGLFLAAIGLIIILVEKIPGVGRLPGDILIKKENFTFFFPITTGLLVSIVLSLILMLFNWK